ncbi:hypothetical protein [Vibrio alginolyticus]|uniref:hypothetical protein n=1 Tax=Vibrio alginolyticus TaxID=663 RepID=UPI003748D5A4
MTLDNNRVRELLVKMTHHRQTCLPLVSPQSHMTLARAAYRFVKIEKVMIKKMAKLFFDQDGEQFIAENATEYGVAELGNYKEMHFMNKLLLDDLKALLRAIDDTNLTALVSYWLAALQVENDEIEKHLPQGE